MLTIMQWERGLGNQDSKAVYITDHQWIFVACLWKQHATVFSLNPCFLWGNSDHQGPLRWSIQDSEMTACCVEWVGLNLFFPCWDITCGKWITVQAENKHLHPRGRGRLVGWHGWNSRTLVWILTLLSISFYAEIGYRVWGGTKDLAM